MREWEGHKMRFHNNNFLEMINQQMSALESNKSVLLAKQIH